MSEPTMKDTAKAAAFLNAAFGYRVTGAHVESLAWLIADVRDTERIDTINVVSAALAAGIPMGEAFKTTLPNSKAGSDE